MAAAYLEERGVTILERNYRCRMGELDLIAKDGEYLVFVEVKYRCDKESGHAAEAVDSKKQRVISRVAAYYLMSRRSTLDLPCRFDVVAVEDGGIRWYQNAFEYCP